MKVEILSVGTEILLGDILNTNTHFLSLEMARVGMMVYHHTSVGDNPQRLKEAIETALSRVDIVIATGGLGPTEDDITLDITAEVFGMKVIYHEPSVEKTNSFHTRRGTIPAPNVTRQCRSLEGAEVLFNTNGFAPGTIAERDGKTIILLPGPPEEMKNMYRTKVMPYLQGISGEVLVSRAINLSGIGESDAEHQIKDLIEGQTNPTIAPYAKPVGVVFRITAKANTEEEAIALIEPVADELYKRFGNNIYGENETTLESAIIKELTEKGLTLSIAESITGGMVTSTLIGVEGASKVVLEGLVAYDPSSKINRGLVTKEILDNEGVVSEQVAKNMAENIAKITGSDIGISSTGLADIGDGTSLSYLGVSYKGDTRVIKHTASGKRQRVRRQTTTTLLHNLRQTVLERG